MGLNWRWCGRYGNSTNSLKSVLFSHHSVLAGDWPPSSHSAPPLPALALCLGILLGLPQQHMECFLGEITPGIPSTSFSWLWSCWWWFIHFYVGYYVIRNHRPICQLTKPILWTILGCSVPSTAQAQSLSRRFPSPLFTTSVPVSSALMFQGFLPHYLGLRVVCLSVWNNGVKEPLLKQTLGALFLCSGLRGPLLATQHTSPQGPGRGLPGSGAAAGPDYWRHPSCPSPRNTGFFSPKECHSACSTHHTFAYVKLWAFFFWNYDSFWTQVFSSMIFICISHHQSL